MTFPEGKKKYSVCFYRRGTKKTVEVSKTDLDRISNWAISSGASRIPIKEKSSDDSHVTHFVAPSEIDSVSEFTDYDF